MKIIVIGYGEMFANLVLGCLQAGHNVVGVFRHDKVLYAPFYLAIKDTFAPSKDKSFINSLKLNEIEAHSVNSQKFYNEVLKLNPDIILVGSWSERFKQKIIKLPKIGCINCHPSLLPKYRGPNPYAQTIIHGETKTGITFHLMDDCFDTGAILYQKEVEILPDDTGETLKNRCVKNAKFGIMTLLNNIDSEIIIPIQQSEKNSSYQTQLSEKDILLDFNQPAIDIDRRIRGLTPWLKCYIPHKNSFFKIDTYKIIENNTNIKEPAVIVKKGKNLLQITCLDNKIIEFRNVKLLGALPFLATNLYLKIFVKEGDKAV